MTARDACRSWILAVALLMLALPAGAQQTTETPFEPQVGQAGKDVVWVPTPQALVEKMLDMAKVTPQDFHMDLGSGDGRTVITAARRGARSLGVEFNPKMVELSRRNAQTAGVSNRATFQEGDLFEADLSKANVITLFLLPSINMKLRPKLLELRPGTRIVSNTFSMEDWEADETQTISGDCSAWCTALLWIVPAKVEGTWKLGQNQLVLKQRFQMLSGTLGSTAIANGRLHGNEITFTAGNATYTGQVEGNAIKGMSKGGSGGAFTATR
ncbi:MAG: class I SAM-dependent methyltransferase [Acidobacteria bacterium]|nr:class I SAM-dependent methyltransferase [Acidobacteriota bacterium]